MKPVLYGVAFSKKLRVRHVAYRGRAAFDNTPTRARGDGALHDDYEVVRLYSGRPIQRRVDLTQVGGPRLRRRGPRRDQHDFSQGLRDVLVVEEAELCLLHNLPNEILETRLVNGRLAALESTDPLSADVHSQNVMACFREARGSHLANMPQAYDGYFHYSGLSTFFGSALLLHRVYHYAEVRRSVFALNKASPTVAERSGSNPASTHPRGRSRVRGQDRLQRSRARRLLSDAF